MIEEEQYRSFMVSSKGINYCWLFAILYVTSNFLIEILEIFEILVLAQ